MIMRYTRSVELADRTKLNTTQTVQMTTRIYTQRIWKQRSIPLVTRKWNADYLTPIEFIIITPIELIINYSKLIHRTWIICVNPRHRVLNIYKFKSITDFAAQNALKRVEIG